jgi:Rab3 GTPase-activating protein regulatory subunit N-terminus
MSLRLRARRLIDRPAAERILCGPRRRRVAPKCWSWAWPTENDIDAGNDDGDGDDENDPAWLAEVHSVAVSDGGEAVAFVSSSGKVVLAVANAKPPAPPRKAKEEPPETMRVVELIVDLSRLHDAEAGAADMFIHATSIAFFHMADPLSHAVDLVVAVGYDSGAVVLFDATSAVPCAITRPSLSQPVRRLRFVPAFHLLSETNMTAQQNQSYPYPTQNSGLFACFGVDGKVGRLPTPALNDAIASRRFDTRGAGWIMWRLNAQDAVVDATPCSSEPNAICEMDASPPEVVQLRIVAAGINPSLAAFACGDLPAFSARDVARKAATAVYSAAKGAIFSRITSVVPSFSFGATTVPPVTPSVPSAANITLGGISNDGDEDGGKVLFAAARTAITWADEPDTSSQLLRFGFQDINDTARKSVASILARRRAGQLPQITPGSNAHTSDTLPQSPCLSAAAAMSLDGVPSAGGPRVRLDATVAANALPQNIRMIQLCVSAPLPSTLLATCDTLGRILILDSRDMCVLRMLKGYRDSHVAWLARGGPILVVLAPRRSLIEVHSPLTNTRRAAFHVPPGSLLVQSTSFSVFLVSPNGVLYEIAPARKREEETTMTNASSAEATPESLEIREEIASQRPHVIREVLPPPPSERVCQFLDACKDGQTSHAVEVLDEMAAVNIQHVAHLMALLVCTSSCVRSEVHVAVAAKAARLASDAGNTDLETRYEAHSRLGEVFGLLAAEVLSVALPSWSNEARISSNPHSVSLGSDNDLCSYLLDFADEDEEFFPPPLPAADYAPSDGRRRSKKRVGSGEVAFTTKGSASISASVNCERFILAHAILPRIGPNIGRGEYMLQPREDLSRPERLWLARSYFARLFTRNENDLVRGADPEPSASRDVFLALGDVLGFSVENIATQFVDAFLWTPVEHLLRTPLALSQSSLRYAINRLRANRTRGVVDDIFIHACESTTRIANALLLVRLCVVQEDKGFAEVDARFLLLLDQLGQAVQLRAHVFGSRAEIAVKGRITARHFQGDAGEAERQAVSLLAESFEDSRAAGIIAGLSSKFPQLEWHESASVSEVALAVARRRLAVLLPIDSSLIIGELSPNVVQWIRESGSASIRSSYSVSPSPLADGPEPAKTVRSRQLVELKGAQMLLIAALENFPASSIDAARCLQLAEVTNVLLRIWNKDLGEMDSGHVSS